MLSVVSDHCEILLMTYCNPQGPLAALMEHSLTPRLCCSLQLVMPISTLILFPRRSCDEPHCKPSHVVLMMS